MKRYQLKTKRKMKSFCILPFCSDCGIRLHDKNAYRKKNKRFKGKCKKCEGFRMAVHKYSKKSDEFLKRKLKIVQLAIKKKNQLK